jgi:hypothetical protein
MLINEIHCQTSVAEKTYQGIVGECLFEYEAY